MCDETLNLVYNEVDNIKNGGIAKEYKYLLGKSNRSVCKITKNNMSGSGFFCKIQDPQNEDKILRVLFTCYNVLQLDNLDNFNEINYSVDNKKNN